MANTSPRIVAGHGVPCPYENSGNCGAEEVADLGKLRIMAP